MKVLIVEGDKPHAQMYQDAFEIAGHQTEVALGAQQALHKLDKFSADVILLNLILPGRSGVEVLQELVSYDDWKLIPVILLTDNHPSTFKISTSDMAKYSVARLVYTNKNTPSDIVKIAGEVVGEKV